MWRMVEKRLLVVKKIFIYSRDFSEVVLLVNNFILSCFKC